MLRWFFYVPLLFVVYTFASDGAWIGWGVAGFVTIGVLFDATIAEVELVSDGVRYRRFRRWRFIPYREIKSVHLSRSGRTHLRLHRPIPPWGRLYFEEVRVLPLSAKLAFLQKIEAGMEAHRVS